MKKILFICSANTCRSVIAEQLATYMYDDYEFSSAGVRADEGAPMMKGAYKALDAHGINPELHNAVQLTTEMGNDADLIICINESHHQYLKTYFPYIQTPAVVMKHDPGDPSGMPPEVYAKSVKAMKDSIAEILTEIKPANISMLDELDAAEHICFTHPWEKDSMEFALKDDTYTFLTASINGRLAAYGCTMTAADECTIMNIAVLPEYRSRGISTVLLNELINDGISRNASRFFLEVRESNTKARSLYKKFGFSETGIRKNYYSDPSENAIIMTKEARGR